MYEWIAVGVGVIILLMFIRDGLFIIRPTQLGLVERLGKYKRMSDQGFHIKIPFIEKVIKVNTTEQMVDTESQEIITKDRLNATVDAQVYFKVKRTEEAVKASQYNVRDHIYQIVNLAKTTLRNIIGNLSYDKANSNRDAINGDLCKILEREAAPWGIEIVRTELKEIEPTEDVQKSMNEVIKAENTKKAAIDQATAVETKADGERRAAIKQAEGTKRSTVLRAEGDAEAIERVAQANANKYKLEQTALQKHFKKEAQVFKKLETTEAALKRNAKYVIDPNSKITNVIADAAGVVPIKQGK